MECPSVGYIPEAWSHLIACGFAGRLFLKEDWCFLALLAPCKFQLPPKSLLFFNSALIIFQVSANLMVAISKALIISSFATPVGGKWLFFTRLCIQLDVSSLLSRAPTWRGLIFFVGFLKLTFLTAPKQMDILPNLHQASLLQLQWPWDLSPKRRQMALSQPRSAGSHPGPGSAEVVILLTWTHRTPYARVHFLQHSTFLYIIF